MEGESKRRCCCGLVMDGDGVIGSVSGMVEGDECIVMKI